MPKLNTTSDDSSPLIAYYPPGAWHQNYSNDAFNGGYTSTWTQNATATFQFSGTWVAVKGSRNPSHGAYNITLDGYSYAFNGSAPVTFQTDVFNSRFHPIENGHHTLVITNIGRKTLDIDSITWSCDVGGLNTSDVSLQKSVVDDTDDAFTYFPQGSWDVDHSDLGNFPENTGHGCRCKLHIFRDAVAIYGTTGPQNSRYSVLPPNRPRQEFTATRDVSSSQVLLYFGNGFGPGNHTIGLANQSPGLFQIDFAVVHAVSSPSSSPSSSSAPVHQASPYLPSDPVLPSDRAKLPAGAIVAITFAAFIFFFLLAALWFILRRNKTLWMRLQRGYMVQSQFDSSTPPNGITPLPYSTPPHAGTRHAPANDAVSIEAGSLNRAVTMQSASTLVADHGSLMTQVGDYDWWFSLKPRGGDQAPRDLRPPCRAPRLFDMCKNQNIMIQRPRG
ncbi:hypothetical protein B0H15DRAFT_275439 [Mycena belliarum]|uniref:Uncharacterized protein n=1 Tax=Mycena belliarum TaxID=1033014 RepID=A0AAD6U457_9AGAR|nr:hypothetical protein B0H15DRAFT_275439 [Mycena belliae]